MGSTLKTDTVLSNETFEIKRELCAFGPIGGGVPQLLSNYLHEHMRLIVSFVEMLATEVYLYDNIL